MYLHVFSSPWQWCSSRSFQVYYNVLSGHPFMSWGENVIVGVQNTIVRASHWQLISETFTCVEDCGSLILLAEIIFLYWHYSPQLSKASVPLIKGL